MAIGPSLVVDIVWRLLEMLLVSLSRSFAGSVKGTAILGVLLVAGCHRSSQSTTVAAAPWSPSPDVIALAALYGGGENQCSKAPPLPSPRSVPATQRWICAVAGWTDVTLMREGGVSEPVVRAHSDNPFQCEFQRFSDDAGIVNTMQAAILTQTVALLRSGPLAGACMMETTVYAGRAGCDVTIFAPTERADYGSRCRDAFKAPRSGAPG